MDFNTTFYASPVVIVSVHHDYDPNMKYHIPPEHNIITAWVEVRHNSLLHAYQQQFGPRYSLENLRVNTVNTVHSLFTIHDNRFCERLPDV